MVPGTGATMSAAGGECMSNSEIYFQIFFLKKFFLWSRISSTNNCDMVTASRVIAFDGLDSAIIGTCNTAEGREVIAYDYRKVVECFESMDCSFNKDFEEWWRDMTDSIPAEAIPVFVNLDYTVRDEILAQRSAVRH